MKAVVLVPRRIADPHREVLWAYVRSWWERSPWPVIEGYHVATEGPFNRSAALNRAATIAGDWDVAVIADGDTVVNHDQVAAAIQRAHETGRMVLAFDEWLSLDQDGTDRILRGYAGSWRPFVRWDKDNAVSSCLAVPRHLWNNLGGFDERFRGWGFEDRAFFLAARASSGVDRIPGAAWHLWHPRSNEKNPKHADYRANQILAARYRNEDPTAVALEHQPPDLALMVITNGRRTDLEASVPSLLANVSGQFARRIIHDDSGDRRFIGWLEHRFGPDGFEIVATPSIGYARAMGSAWSVFLATGLRFAWWHEEDFLYRQPVDVDHLVSVLEARPYLAQIVLKRQPWFPGEIRAGGIVERNPDAYQDVTDPAGDWLEHRQFVSMNPGVFSRSFAAANPWRDEHHAETNLGRRYLDANPDGRFALWGPRGCEPWVEHIGERTGHGY